MGTTMTDGQEPDEEQEDVVEEPVEVTRGPTGPAGPIGPTPALADADEDPDVLAAANMSELPRGRSR